LFLFGKSFSSTRKILVSCPSLELVLTQNFVFDFASLQVRRHDLVIGRSYIGRHWFRQFCMQSQSIGLSGSQSG